LPDEVFDMEELYSRYPEWLTPRVIIWDAESFKAGTPHTDEIHALNFSGGGKVVVYRSDGQSLWKWWAETETVCRFRTRYNCRKIRS